MIKLYIDSKLVTFYADEDEQILINRKIKDYRDIEKVFGDFTESFTIPANSNNHIFLHYYDPDIENGFDARVKVDSELYIDDVLFKRGYINLTDVQIKNNRASSYTIQFFTEIPKISDLFGEDELRDLDFSALDHPYSYSEIKDRIVGPFTPVNGTFETLFYPLISYKRRYFYNTGLTLDGETQTDLADSGSGNAEGVSFTEFKPAVSHRYIIQRIEAKYGITINSPVFNTLDYLFLMMQLGNTTGNEDVTSQSTYYNQQLTIANENVLLFNQTLTPTAGFENVQYAIIIKYDNEERFRFPSQGYTTGTSVLNNINVQVFSENKNCEIIIESNENFVFGVDLEISRFQANGATVVLDTVQQSFSNTIEMVVSEQFQDFKVVDFLKAFIKMFNLVIEPISATEFNFTPINDYYSSGELYDVSDYVDTEQLKVSPGELISGIDLKYEKNETFLSYQYDKKNGRGFGSLEVDFVDGNGDKLIGERISVELPFEKPVFESITNGLTYGYYVDEKQDEFLPYHSLFFVRTDFVNDIYLKNSAGVSEAITPLIPVTCLDPQTNLALNFENEFDERTGQENTKNLYSDYYRDYIGDLYSPNRRTFSLSAKLPTFISTVLKLNDRLLIGQTRYLINSLQHNLTTNIIKFELLNDIFEGDEALLQPTSLERTFFLLDSEEHRFTVRANGNYDITLTSDLQGWTSSSYVGNQINIEVDANSTGANRNGEVVVRFSDPLTTTITIFITQLKEVITADTITITADNNIITADNG